MNIFNEVMSRARMRSPQNVNSEASRRNGHRGARRIAMQARRRQARDMSYPIWTIR